MWRTEIAAHTCLFYLPSKDVLAPAPSLFLRDLDQYKTELESASGEVMIQFLKYAGFPAVQW